MIKSLFPLFFMDKRHPQAGDYVKLLSLTKDAHFAGVEGYIRPFKKGYLVIEKGNTTSFIRLENNKIQYEMNGIKYKF